MESYTTRPFVCGSFQSAYCFQGSSTLSYFTSTSSWVILLCMYTARSVYPFICWWTLGLFPPFGYCERCYYEHLLQVSAWVPLFNYFRHNPGDCWVMWDFYTYLSEALPKYFPQVLHHFILPPAMYKESSFLSFMSFSSLFWTWVFLPIFLYVCHSFISLGPLANDFLK